MAPVAASQRSSRPLVEVVKVGQTFLVDLADGLYSFALQGVVNGQTLLPLLVGWEDLGPRV